MCCAWTNLCAQTDFTNITDTIINGDTLRTYQYADTLKPEDLVNVSSHDEILLEMLAQQGIQRAAQYDSVQATIMPNPLFLPLIFIPKQLHFADSLQNAYTQVAIRQAARDYITTHRIELYTGVLDSMLIKKEDIEKLSASQNQIQMPEKFLVKDAEEEEKSIIRRIKNQYSPLRHEAITMLQFTQNYISQNWYAGGNSNFALLGVLQGAIYYDNKKNITWENTGEWRAGLNTIHGDSLRKVNCNEDLFRLYTKFGYKVVTDLYISASAEFKTQFFRTWKDNTETLKTGPFTPVRFNLALGLDYKPVKGLSIVFAPVTYKLVYASDTIHVAPSSYGIEQGDILNDVGSSLRVDWTWRPLREIALDSKFYFYTNYKKVELDWELVCNFIINRYLSARVSLHPRYDNTVVLENAEKAKLQFKEMLSIGFAHKFY